MDDFNVEIETSFDQENIEKNRNDDSNSADTFFREDHEEEVIAYSLLLGGSFIVVASFNLLNFNVNVTHGMQVLGFFLLWSNKLWIL